MDFQIVGEGTSGLTITKCLIEAGHIVTVVKAGSFYEIFNGNLSQIPAYTTRGSTDAVTNIPPLMDWGFITTPQPVSAMTIGSKITDRTDARIC